MAQVVYTVVDATITPGIVENAGGTLIRLSVPGLADGDYQVRVGPAGDKTDPLCYFWRLRIGSDGLLVFEHGRDIPSITLPIPPATDGDHGVFECFTPRLPSGGPYRFYLEPVAGGAAIRTAPILSVENAWYRSRTFSFRRRFPPIFKTGPRNTTSIPLQAPGVLPRQSASLEGLASAIGDDLTRLAGFRITRLTAQLKPAKVIQSGAESASSANGTLVTLATPAVFAAGVLAGQTFGLLGGGSGVVQSVAADRKSLTLASSVGVFSGMVWQIARASDTAALVESTFDWPAAGQIVIEDVAYRYAAKTVSSFTGLEFWDGVSWTAGVKHVHAPLVDVIDTSGLYSAVDLYRRSFLATTADGEDLDVVGRNLSVLRPPPLDDDAIFRELIMATAYTPRGLIWAMERALDVILGVGGYEIFEDLSVDPRVPSDEQPLGAGGIARIDQAKSRHLCRVFIRRTAIDPTPRGRLLIEGPEIYVASSATQVTIGAPAPVTGDWAVTRVIGVRLADDLGQREILRGEDASGAVVSGRTVVSLASGSFAGALPGDLFVLDSGPLTGVRSPVVALVSGNAQVQLGPMVGTPGIALLAFEVADWHIVRPFSNARWYRLVTDGWTYGPNEVAETTLVAAGASGPCLAINVPLNGTAHYSRPAQITPESDVALELLFQVPAAGLGTAPDDNLQLLLGLKDGRVSIDAGLVSDGAGGVIVQWTNGSSGAALPGLLSQALIAGAWVTLRVEKHGLGDVRLLLDGREVLVAPYGSFPGDANPAELHFGCWDTAHAAFTLNVKHVDWRVETPTDFWNLHELSGTTVAPATVGRPLAFPAGSVGKRLRITQAALRNARGGRAVGEWEVVAQSLGTATVIGPRQIRASFSQIYPTRVIVHGDDQAFFYPDSLGHEIEIMDGPNIGVYTIARVIDPASGRDLDTRPDGQPWTANVDGPGRGPRTSSNMVEVAGPVSFQNVEVEVPWRLRPIFPNDNVVFELVDAGTRTGAVLTLPAALPGTLPSPARLAVAVTRVRSAYLLDSRARNELLLSGGDASYPAYLSDRAGWIRGVLFALKAAGVEVDFDRLARTIEDYPLPPGNPAGIHVW